MTTLLALAKDACDELSIQRPDTLFGLYNEGDTSDRKLVRAATRCCRYLAQSWDWQALRATHSWTTIAAEGQTGGKPADFLRYVPDTFWHASLSREVVGPKTAAEWERYTSGIQTTATPIWYEEGGVIYIKPQPAAGETIRYRYIRSAIGKNAAASFISAFTADTDVPLWDDELMIQGIVFHYRQIEKTADAADEVQFKRLMHDRIKQDGGSRPVNMSGRSRSADDRVREMRANATVIEITS